MIPMVMIVMVMTTRKKIINVSTMYSNWRRLEYPVNCFSATNIINNATKKMMSDNTSKGIMSAMRR